MPIEKHLEVAGVEKLNIALTDILGRHGFELHPFLVGWYNEKVNSKFCLDYAPNTLAFVVISQPSMFEEAFIPFLKSSYQNLDSIHDPIDQCMLHHFSLVTRQFPSVVALHDFQLNHTRRPKILVQTAGHVSGAVRFYHAPDHPETKNKMYPVCHHPVWGGWFALRGVLIFTSLQAKIPRNEPSDNLSEDEVEQLLQMYNGNWKNWKWRDIGRPQINIHNKNMKYSELQIKYFETAPVERKRIIEQIIQH